MPARFLFAPVIPPFAGAGQTEAVVAGYVELLESLGGERLGDGGLADPAPLVLLIATGGTEGAALELLERRSEHVAGEPVLLVAHPGNNSLPAALELLARVRQVGATGRIAYLRGLDDEAGRETLERALGDADTRSRLHATRIGLVGTPSDWLVASSPEPGIVAEVWGPAVVPIPMNELSSAMEKADPAAVDAAATALAEGATACLEPSGDALADAARVLVGLRAVIEQHRLDALTVRCFDIVLERATSGCYALSELTDEGIVAGCEGDLASTIGMLWARLLTGETPWMANPADLDEAANTIQLAHCTVPRTMVEDYSLRSHFESGLGVGIQGTLPHGPVTLLRVGGVALDELWLAEGELTEVSAEENLCRTQARIALTDGDVSDLLHAPLGNHIVLVRGHHADRLQDWWETML